MSKRRSTNQYDHFLHRIEMNRERVASSIMEFDFNMQRTRVLSKVDEFPEWGTGVIYCMFRDQRVQDNWAMLYAQKLAIVNEVPLHVCFCVIPKFLTPTIRHFDFVFKGLETVEYECRKLNIEFHLLANCEKSGLSSFVKSHQLGAVVIDFCPLREPMSWANKLNTSLPPSVPLIQVDAHNIVPVWVTSGKQEYAARTIRPKIHEKLDEFLTEFPPVIRHPFKSNFKAKSIDWERVIQTTPIDWSVEALEQFTPGYEAGMETLLEFVTQKINDYNDYKNDPTIDALSNISPWLHFGQIAPQRCVLVAEKSRSNHKDGVWAFLEEIIVRRELTDNFCYYNKHYDSIDGAEDWAYRTLQEHKKDEREYVYSRKQLEGAKTHDDLWNAAQRQLRLEGKMHGYLRMYWAKKILEWTAKPEIALRTSIYLNDKYSLDGRDPNSYVGCMWSICGTHDRPWPTRRIFGKIRYMNYEGCRRKFDVEEFETRYQEL